MGNFGNPAILLKLLIVMVRVDEKVRIPDDGVLVVGSEYEGNLKTFFLDPLSELAEALALNKHLNLNPVRTKSYYFANFGLNCIEFYLGTRYVEYLFEAYKACGYAEQAYRSETTAEQRLKDNEKRISEGRKYARMKKHEQEHGSWKPYLKEIIENTDWSTAIKKDNSSQRTKYLMVELQKKIDDKGLYNGVRGGGVTFKWVNDFLKEYDRED